jgi:serine/threonine protein kinase
MYLTAAILGAGEIIHLLKDMKIYQGCQEWFEMSQPSFIRAEIPAGTLIDNRYMIQRILGQGGLGRTYLAEDTRRFSELCVLKEFAPNGSGEHNLEKSRNLFKREAKILHQVQHPQIPKFLACFEGEGRLFLVQEYVNGQAYSTLLRERQNHGQAFSEAEVIDWLKNLLPVLGYIHDCNIIHRDISPDNIMLPTGSSLPVLIDFGVGKQLADLRESTSENQSAFVGKMSLVGKIGYAPREQISLGRCSPSSDLYALGVTAIVLLTGRDPANLMNQYSLEWEWQNFSAVGDRLSTVLNKMLVDTPKNRYQSVQEVLSDLEQLDSLDSSPRETLANFPNDLYAAPERLSGETLVSLPENPFNFSNLEQENQTDESPRPVKDAPASPERGEGINSVFIEQCRRELAFCIGPIASLVIEEILDQGAPMTLYQLVDALEKEIPEQQAAIAFRRRLLF